MKKQILITPLLITLLIFLAAGLAIGQNALLHLKGDIPFDFTVIDKAMVAGNYDVLPSPVTASPSLLIRSADNNDAAVFLTLPVVKKEEIEPKLVFRRYGDQYFLAQIWGGGTKIGCELPKSAKERLVAQNQPEPQLIYVAAK